jgi:hypothetical protein
VVPNKYCWMRKMASGCQYPGPDTVMAPIEIHPACEKKGNASGKVLVIPHPIQGDPKGGWHRGR